MIDKKILKVYDKAFHEYVCFGDSVAMESFKLQYPNEFAIIDKMYRRRVDLKTTIDALLYLNEPIYWFTLTFNNDKNSNLVASKRKDAQRFLNEIAPIYIMVEEYGEDNNRYHIHGFLIFKYGKGFKDFTQWHSRQKLELLKTERISKKIKYLTKYAVKSVPRLRRSKMCCKMYHAYKGSKKLVKRGLESLMIQNVIQPIIDNDIILF